MEERKPCVLDTRQTFGKEKNKFLYRCFPDDKSAPLLIPYEIPYQFMKKKLSYYVLVSYNLPIGKLIHNIGEVNETCHYYEYLLYCKNLYISQRKFNQIVLKKIKDIDWDLPFRDANVFTIDGKTSIDLDDGFSVDTEKVSIYISCVPYILDKLELWKNMSNRVSTIYLPDKKHPMLPTFLSTLCSLNEGTTRPCLVLDLYMDGTVKWSLCTTKIHKNYTYETGSGKEYETLVKMSGCKTSKDVVHYYMTLFNTKATILKKGIHLNIHKPEELPEDWLPVYFNQYSFYDTSGEYIQMTSPIRRLVDILNMTQLIKELDLYPIQDKMFHDEWYNKVEEINAQYRSIRKIQNTTKLLELFDQNQHKVFDGIVWQQKVYLKEIGLMIPFKCELEEYSTHSFMIYVFHDEAHLTRKIRVQLV